MNLLSFPPFLEASLVRVPVPSPRDDSLETPPTDRRKARRSDSLLTQFGLRDGNVIPREDADKRQLVISAVKSTDEVVTGIYLPSLPVRCVANLKSQLKLFPSESTSAYSPRVLTENIVTGCMGVRGKRDTELHS